jgi:pyridinium-3,5-biscarboxylic acid mononucleotide sulfurtransferase
MMASSHIAAMIHEGNRGRSRRMRRTDRPVTSGITGKLERLREEIAALRRVVVAFSGGVDSSLVLKVAADVLQDGAIGVLAVSPSLPQSEKDEAVELAHAIGARLELVETGEVADASYAANAPNRCFFCKDHVYAALRAFADQHGIAHVLDGMNADDTMDIRPGRAAAMKHGVRSPLHDLGFTKADVREAAKSLGLPTWDKPAAACLSSRIPYGTPVTVDLLRRIEAAEGYVRSLGFRELRVRHHGDVARLEIPASEFDAALARQQELVGGLKALGWLYVTLDLEGLRTGSMNEALKSRALNAAATHAD